MQERMFFGLSGPEGAIPDADWDAFMAEVVTPRFPGGLTVLEAKGQWQGRDKQVTRESSRVVEIIHDNSKGASRRVGEIAAEYRARYRQESVLDYPRPYQRLQLGPMTRTTLCARREAFCENGVRCEFSRNSDLAPIILNA